MDPCPLKVDLAKDYDEMSRGEQKAFLKELGPFRTLASKDSKYRRVRVLWFRRWPLQVERYIDREGMNHREEQIWNVSIISLPGFF